MKSPRISGRVVLKYALLQLPGTVLFVLILLFLEWWMHLSCWLVWGLAGIWVAKEIILFPFVWRSYDARGSNDEHDMIGKRGKARERLNPEGYISVRGELWRAESVNGEWPVEKGARVTIRGIRGLTLLVEPEKNDRLETERNSHFFGKTGDPER